MISLETQIRQLAEFADETMPWVDPADIQNPVTVSEHPSHRSSVRGTPRPWIGIAVAALAFVVIASLSLLLSGTAGDEAPAESAADRANDPAETTIPLEAPVRTTVPGATATTAPGPDDSGPFAVDWVPASWDGVAPRWITAYPSGGGVAGSLGQPARFSNDGITWTTDPFDEALKKSRDLYVEGRFALANAVPLHDSRPPFTFDENDLLWIPGQTQSPSIRWQVVLEYVDETWVEVDVDRPLWEPPVRSGNTVLTYPVSDDYDDEYQVYDTSSGHYEHLATLQVPGIDQGRNARPQFAAIPGGFAVYDDLGRLHTSSDGITWADHSGARPDHSPSPRRPLIINIVRSGDDVYAQPWRDRELWVSSSGASWTQYPEPWMSVETRLRALHAAGDGLVLTTHAGDGSTFIAVTANGYDWRRVSNPPKYDPTNTSDGDFPLSTDPSFEVAGDTVFFIHAGPDGAATVEVGQLP